MSKVILIQYLVRISPSPGTENVRTVRRNIARRSLRGGFHFCQFRGSTEMSLNVNSWISGWSRLARDLIRKNTSRPDGSKTIGPAFAPTDRLGPPNPISIRRKNRERRHEPCRQLPQWKIRRRTARFSGRSHDLGSCFRLGCGAAGPQAKFVLINHEGWSKREATGITKIADRRSRRQAFLAVCQ